MKLLLRIGCNDGSCEHDEKSSGFITAGGFLLLVVIFRLCVTISYFVFFNCDNRNMCSNVQFQIC
jgi:hypothetical protein